MTTKKTFGWFPDASLTLNIEPSVVSTRFGDGYEQRTKDGITPILEKWELKFTGNTADILAIDKFLREHGGWKAFHWVNPDRENGAWVCRSWRRTRTKGVINSLTATFEQVPEI